MRQGSDRGFDRVVFFSDAVVAIAITLLILPVLDRINPDGSLSDLLHADRSELIAFALSFGVIAQYWITHHSLFESIDRYNLALLWLNMLWLLSIVFLPFPTEVLGVRGSGEAGVRALYMASVLANSLALLLLELAILRSPELWVPGRRPDPPTAGLTMVGAMTVALVVGTAVPTIGLWALILLVAARPAAHWQSRRRRR